MVTQCWICQDVTPCECMHTGCTGKPTLSHLTATLPKMAQVARETSPKAPSPILLRILTSSCSECTHWARRLLLPTLNSWESCDSTQGTGILSKGKSMLEDSFQHLQPSLCNQQCIPVQITCTYIYIQILGRKSNSLLNGWRNMRYLLPYRSSYFEQLENTHVQL